MSTRRAWLTAAVLAAGCDDTLFGVAEGTIELAEGYAGVVEIASTKCYGCHSAAAAPVQGFGLDLETDLHAATVGVTGGYGVPLVTPGAIDDSLLYLKVTGENPAGTGVRMPPGAPLGTDYTDVIAAWIEDGAPAE